MVSDLFLKYILLVILALGLAGCYHLRVHPDPIHSRTFESSRDLHECLHRIRNSLENDLHLRILEHGNAEHTSITTSPHHFGTDTGFGQPPGGRKYYTQLLITATRKEGKTTITVSPHNYEIRTSYAYNQDGRVATMYKHYPYDEYPGMFDNSRLEKELATVTETLEKGLAKP